MILVFRHSCKENLFAEKIYVVSKKSHIFAARINGRRFVISSWGLLLGWSESQPLIGGRREPKPKLLYLFNN